MSDYTHKRLPDVDDMAPQFGMPAEMQARFAARPLGLERTGLTYFRLAPGFRIPFAHRHEDQEEVYVVIRGSARIKIGDDVLDLSELDAVRVPGDTLRNLEGRTGRRGGDRLRRTCRRGAERDGPRLVGRGLELVERGAAQPELLRLQGRFSRARTRGLSVSGPRFRRPVGRARVAEPHQRDLLLFEGERGTPVLHRGVVAIELDLEAGEALSWTSTRAPRVPAGTIRGGALPPCIATGVQTIAGVPVAISGPPAAIE